MLHVVVRVVVEIDSVGSRISERCFVYFELRWI